MTGVFWLAVIVLSQVDLFEGGACFCLVVSRAFTAHSHVLARYGVDVTG